MTERTLLAVKIVGKHPHRGETGTMECVDGSIELNYLGMVLVKLDECKHGNDACYALPENLRLNGRAVAK